MSDEIFDQDEEITRMFTDKKASATCDEELALHIFHRFNISRDTLETMPAFEQHIEPLFSKVKEK